MEKKLTIFTPTYNRSNTLKKCYSSLVNQTSKDFIWMIIDDGSTDETERIVNDWISDCKIDIEYIYKENGGKADTINRSLLECKTELWLCLDSDDYLTASAVESIISNYDTIKNDNNVCGLIALRTAPDGNVMNNQKRIPSELKYTTLYHIRYELNIETEYVCVYKSQVIKKYPYPILNNEKFMPLSYVYDQIDVDYQYLVVQEKLMISEYFEDGITRNKNELIKKNPKGYILFNKQRIKIARSLKFKLKAIVLYIVGCTLDKDTSIYRCIKNSPSKLLTITMYPLAILIYLKRFH